MVPKIRSGKAIRKLKRAAPYILSGLSAVGVFASAFLSAKATVKAVEVVKEKELQDKGEILKASWKYYIPTALTTIVTAACIITCAAFNKQQVASLTSAYALLAQNYKRYRAKVKEIYGAEAEQKIRNELLVEVPKKDVESVCFHSGYFGNCTTDFGTEDEETKHLFMDGYTKRCFTTSISKVLQAEIAVNCKLTSGEFVSLNDFYEYLGLEPYEGGDVIGWYICDGYQWLDFYNHKERIEEPSDGSEPLEALIIDYDWYPETEETLAAL